MWANSTVLSYIQSLVAASFVIDWPSSSQHFDEDGNWCWISSPVSHYSTSEAHLPPDPDLAFGLGPSPALIQAFLVASFLYCYATIFTLHIPAYFHRRASRSLLLYVDGLDHSAKLWSTVLRPMIDKWRAVVALSALTASAVLGLIQASPTLSEDQLALSIAYFTLIGAMVAVLLSTSLLLHLAGREHDEVFVVSWAIEMRKCSAIGLWNIWTVVSLPLIWSAWTTIGFIAVVFLQIWRQPEAYGPDAPRVTSNLADNFQDGAMQKRFPTFAAGLTITLSAGILQLEPSPELNAAATAWVTAPSTTFNLLQDALAMLQRIKQALLRSKTCAPPASHPTSMIPLPEVRTRKPMPSSEELFEITQVKWLSNDAKHRTLRYFPFNVQAFLEVAVGAAGASECTSVQKIYESAFNRTHLLTFDNGIELIAKIPFHIFGPKYYATASEVATLDFLRTECNLPVPQVRAWCARGEESPVGVEYIMYEKIPGVGLCQFEGGELLPVLHDPFLRVMPAIQRIQSKLLRKTFSQIGNIYYKEDVSEELRARPLYSGDEPATPNSERFRIGPTVDREFWRSGRAKLDLDRGPWPDSQSYMSALARCARACADTREDRKAQDDYRRLISDFEALHHTYYQSILL
ncbi:hypothetical protein NMY22_g14286 [Coprinellus aureogranulatus]|nr:hypothetical protein NMY22_g14286 [Coprinellus aureogranulatus]